MSNSSIIILAQTFENYSDTETPYWKPKGSQTFTLQADSDDFFYGEGVCVKAIETLLARKSNKKWRFEYLSYEIVFHEPIVLSSAEFETELAVVIANNA